MATRESIDEFIKNLSNFKSEIPNTEEDILEELVDISTKEIETSLSNSTYISSEPVSSYRKIEKKKAKSGIVGEQAIYDEFGTGTEGENNPHDAKGEYELNPYNSGKTIRPNKGDDMIADDTGKSIPKGSLYWTFKDSSGNIIRTQGRPAGMHVYKAHKEVKQNMQKIIDKKVGDLLSKL